MREARSTVPEIFLNAMDQKKKDPLPRVPKNTGITVILNSYRRPYNLEMQIEALRKQSIEPVQIWLWVNKHEDNS